MIREGDLRTTLVGFAGALCVLAVLLWFVGVGDVVSALSMASPPVLVVIVVVATCWLTAWGLSLRTVLGVLGAPITIPSAVLVFAGATFANNVTPFGQAGGEPVSALLVSRASDSEYETGLAAIASVDALNFVPSIALALVGWVGYARLARAEAMVLRQAEFVLAARTMGFSHGYILVRHILPNSLSPVVVYLMTDVTLVILFGAALGFLGMGVSPPAAEWGVMIAEGQTYISTAWWISFFPGLAMVLIGVGFALIGDGLARMLRIER